MLDGKKMNTKKIDNLIYISLSPGDYINYSLKQVANKYTLKSGWINGIGAIKNVELGYYNLDSKNYTRKIFNDDYELTSFLGNISIVDKTPFIHSHITLSDKKFKLLGGHLFDAQVSAAGEFMIFSSQQSINRVMNEKIGLPTWCLHEDN